MRKIIYEKIKIVLVNFIVIPFVSIEGTKTATARKNMQIIITNTTI